MGELFKWLDTQSPERAIAATLTFDQWSGRADRDAWEARRIFRLFLARVNRKTYRNAFCRHGKRLTVIPVLEGGGSTNKHYHYHVLIEVPHFMNAAQFVEIMKQAWGRLRGTGIQNTWKECENSGWLQYMLKDRDKDDLLDAIDVCNLWLNKITPTLRRASFGVAVNRGPSAYP